MPDRLRQRNIKVSGYRQTRWPGELLDELTLATVSGAAVVAYALEILAGYNLLERRKRRL